MSRVHGQGTRRSDSAEDTSRRMDTNSRAERARQDAARIKGVAVQDRRHDHRQPETERIPLTNSYRRHARWLANPDCGRANRPMFDSGSAPVKPYMREILQAIGSSLGDVETASAWQVTPTQLPMAMLTVATATGSCPPTAPMPPGASWWQPGCPMLNWHAWVPGGQRSFRARPPTCTAEPAHYHHRFNPRSRRATAGGRTSVKSR